MKRRTADVLACPVDRGPLELIAWESQHDEVLQGVLFNPRLRLVYPILDGVPRMLVFENGAFARFRAAYGERLARELPDAQLPALPSAPGEADVLRSFSAEWVNYDWDGQTYWNLDAQTWFRCMREILDADRRIGAGDRILEVGIGIGATADHLARTRECDLFGVDLGFSVDAAYRHFGTNPNLHIIQASVFAPPFREETFSGVYSFGVIHHTYSTKAAYDQLSRLPRRGGWLFVWVYSPTDEERTLKRRVLMALEDVTRPWISRLPDRAQTLALVPFVPMYMAHQALRRVTRPGSGQVLYGAREAMHAARDRFAPRFIHRHTEAELKSWFLAAGYDRLRAGSEREHPDFVPEPFWKCAGVDGVRG